MTMRVNARCTKGSIAVNLQALSSHYVIILLIFFEFMQSHEFLPSVTNFATVKK